MRPKLETWLGGRAPRDGAVGGARQSRPQARSLDGRRHGTFQIGGLGDIAGQGDGVGVEPLRDQMTGVLTFRDGAARRRYPDPALCQCQRDTLPDTLARAGDHRDLVFQHGVLPR